MSTFTAAQTTTPRPIDVPELLALVFSFLDDRSLARAAQTCRPWSVVALDALWHTLTDLRPLLTLLAPMTSERKAAGRVVPQHTPIVRPHFFDAALYTR
jgi:hypothetical protein